MKGSYLSKKNTLLHFLKNKKEKRNKIFQNLKNYSVSMVMNMIGQQLPGLLVAIIPL